MRPNLLFTLLVLFFAGCTSPGDRPVDGTVFPWPGEGTSASYVLEDGTSAVVEVKRPMVLRDPAGDEIRLLPIGYRLSRDGTIGGFTEFSGASGARLAVASPCDTFLAYTRSARVCGGSDRVSASWLETRSPVGLGAGLVWGRVVAPGEVLTVVGNVMGVQAPISYRAVRNTTEDGCLDFERTTDWRDVGGQYFGWFPNPALRLTMCSDSPLPRDVLYESLGRVTKISETVAPGASYVLDSASDGWWAEGREDATRGSPFDRPDGGFDPTVLSGREALTLAREEAAKAGLGPASSLWLRSTGTLSYAEVELDTVTRTSLGGTATRSIRVESPEGRVLALTLTKRCDATGACATTIDERRELTLPASSMNASSISLRVLMGRANDSLPSPPTLIYVAVAQSDVDRADLVHNDSYVVTFRAPTAEAIGVPYSVVMHAQNARILRLSLPSDAAERLIGLTADDLR